MDRMDQMSPVTILDNESRLLESLAVRIEQHVQLPKDALTSGHIEYSPAWTGPLLPAAAGDLQNPFSVVGSLSTEDVQVILQSVLPRVQQCQVGADSSFVVLTHNSQGRRLTTGGHAGLFQVRQ